MKTRLAVVLAALVVLAAVPAPVAADETRSGGTVVVEAGETVNEDLTAFGGTVVVRGTVNGDVTAFGGNVFVDGRVNGDLEAFAGNVRVNGTVTGNVTAAGGNFLLAQGGEIGGELETAAGNVVVEGEIGRDARVGAGTIRLGPSAVVGGDFVYDGDLDRASGARIDGRVREEPNVNLGVGVGGPLFPDWLGAVYGFLVNFVLGAVALLVFPRFSAGVASRAIADPLRSAGVGLLLFVGVPILLVLLFVSLVGIPLGLFGVLLYAVALWLGYVYGAFALGGWLAGVADNDSKWVALAVGLVAVSLVGFVPILGGLVQFVVLLLGLGALALGGRRRYGGRDETAADSTL
ncbi:polymer-forming cytoskeletal protein [Halorussus gelatinilyticus]|uniref:Polymer-forming cytoskeletal protein n=1 Tax=Halorussus gelatinilyticus TaxID=2937524 RepID=A0A8U0IN12_9EURY|nr:polymer-forming cytoskeletal protein [Halorussus gelatinilyticus]UPW01564.1 polymer-forming cytoskeletal protein [Halorussus gelatinilyticus]